MTKQKTLVEEVVDILMENRGKKFTARELAEMYFERNPEKCDKKMQNTQANTPDKLLYQITAEISSSRKYISDKKDFMSFEDERPISYMYIGCENVPNCEIIPRKNKQPEAELYPKLCDFLEDKDTGMGLVSKRIVESESKKSESGTNEWLHPDIVAFKDISERWENETVQKCVKNNAVNTIEYYSFEVKDEPVKMSNIRKHFFQTVANSSWANYSYFVAPTSDKEDKEAIAELQALCNRHKIGFIQLDPDDPIGGSRIVIPAERKDTVDWNSINRLCINGRFANFLDIANRDMPTEDKRKLLKE